MKKQRLKVQWTEKAEQVLAEMWVTEMEMDAIVDAMSEILGVRVYVQYLSLRVINLRKKGHNIPHRKSGFQAGSGCRRMAPQRGALIAHPDNISHIPRQPSHGAHFLFSGITGIDDGPDRGGKASPMEDPESQALYRHRFVTLVKSVQTRETKPVPVPVDPFAWGQRCL